MEFHYKFVAIKTASCTTVVVAGRHIAIIIASSSGGMEQQLNVMSWVLAAWMSWVVCRSGAATVSHFSRTFAKFPWERSPHLSSTRAVVFFLLLCLFPDWYGRWWWWWSSENEIFFTWWWWSKSVSTSSYSIGVGLSWRRPPRNQNKVPDLGFLEDVLDRPFFAWTLQ